MKKIFIIMFLLSIIMLCNAKSKINKISKLIIKAETYANDRNYNLALRYIDKAIQIDSKWLPSYLAQSKYYQYLNKYQKALKSINKAIELDNNYHISLYVNRYIILMRLQNLKKAKEDSTYIANFKKISITDYSSLAEFYIYTKRYDIALENIEKGLNHKSALDYLLFLRSITYFYSGKYINSLNDLKKISFPRERYLWISILYFKKGNIKEAVNAFRKSNYNLELLRNYSHILKDKYFINEQLLNILITVSKKSGHNLSDVNKTP